MQNPILQNIRCDDTYTVYNLINTIQTVHQIQCKPQVIYNIVDTDIYVECNYKQTLISILRIVPYDHTYTYTYNYNYNYNT